MLMPDNLPRDTNFGEKHFADLCPKTHVNQLTDFKTFTIFINLRFDSKTGNLYFIMMPSSEVSKVTTPSHRIIWN